MVELHGEGWIVKPAQKAGLGLVTIPVGPRQPPGAVRRRRPRASGIGALGDRLGQQLRHAFRQRPSQKVVALEVQVDVLVEKFLPHQTVRALLCQFLLRVGKLDAILFPTRGGVPDDVIDAAVWPESQRVQVAREREALQRFRALAQRQTTCAPTKLHFGKCIVYLVRLAKVLDRLSRPPRFLRLSCFLIKPVPFGQRGSRQTRLMQRSKGRAILEIAGHGADHYLGAAAETDAKDIVQVAFGCA